MSLLVLDRLTLAFDSPEGVITAVEHVSLQLQAGSCTAIVGESGSGKSQLLMACAGLSPVTVRRSGRATFDGHDLLGRQAQFCGRGISVVFQDAAGSLTPHIRVGTQLAEVARVVLGLDGRAARAEALAMLERVRLPRPAQHYQQYPHELSGGMRQRAAIAAALMSRPRLLLADEPTSALDASVQAEIIRLLGGLQRELHMALLLVTHDLAVAAALADQIAVMYAARMVEQGPTAALLSRPQHPYTAGLLAAVPRLGVILPRMQTIAGAPPHPLQRPPGCRFAPRCQQRGERCDRDEPRLQPAQGGMVACHYPLTHAGSGL